MSNFKVGDRVNHIERGDGVVRYIKDGYCNSNKQILVEYDNKFSMGHAGGSADRPYKEGHCYWEVSGLSHILESEFKIGDVVTLKKGLLTGEVDTLGIGIYEIKKIIGKHFTIDYISKDGTYSLKDSFFIYKSNILDLVKDVSVIKTVEIKVKGRTTYATLTEDGKIIKTATARCCPEDTFDFQMGATLAFSRLMEQHKQTTGFDWKGFQKNKFVVNAPTKEVLHRFLQDVETNLPSISWRAGEQPTKYIPYTTGVECCIGCNEPYDKSGLGSGSKGGYIYEGYTVVDYTPYVEYKSKAFDFEAALKPNTVVLCRTKELGDDFAKKVRKIGIKWCTGGDFDNNHYNQYGKETCYNLNKGLEATYCDLDFYQREEFTVIEYTK